MTPINTKLSVNKLAFHLGIINEVLFKNIITIFMFIHLLKHPTTVIIHSPLNTI